MKYQDLKIGKDYYIRVRIKSLRENDFTTDSIDKNGKPIMKSGILFFADDAAAFIPCEELDNPSANIGYLSAKLADNRDHLQNGNSHSAPPAIKVKLSDFQIHQLRN